LTDGNKKFKITLYVIMIWEIEEKQIKQYSKKMICPNHYYVYKNIYCIYTYIYIYIYIYIHIYNICV